MLFRQITLDKKRIGIPILKKVDTMMHQFDLQYERNYKLAKRIKIEKAENIKKLFKNFRKYFYESKIEFVKKQKLGKYRRYHTVEVKRIKYVYNKLLRTGTNYIKFRPYLFGLSDKEKKKLQAGKIITDINIRKIYFNEEKEKIKNFVYKYGFVPKYFRKDIESSKTRIKTGKATSNKKYILRNRNILSANRNTYSLFSFNKNKIVSINQTTTRNVFHLLKSTKSNENGKMKQFNLNDTMKKTHTKNYFYNNQSNLSSSMIKWNKIKEFPEFRKHRNIGKKLFVSSQKNATMLDSTNLLSNQNFLSSTINFKDGIDILSKTKFKNDLMMIIGKSRVIENNIRKENIQGLISKNKFTEKQKTILSKSKIKVEKPINMIYHLKDNRKIKEKKRIIQISHNLREDVEGHIDFEYKVFMRKNKNLPLSISDFLIKRNRERIYNIDYEYNKYLEENLKSDPSINLAIKRAFKT